MNFQKYIRCTEPEIIDLLVAFIVVTSGIMLLQLVLGVFEPVSALFFSLLICGAAGLTFIRKIVFPDDSRNIAAIALMGVLVLIPRWSPFLYIEGGQDQGVYVAMSSYFEKARSLAITDTVRERLNEVQKPNYDKLNNHPSNIVPGLLEGYHQLGVYIRNLDASAYIFQFYPLHPLWMGFAAKIFGEENRVYSLVGFSMLNILMLSLLVYELSGRKRPPTFLAAGLLALNPMHVFFSRFPVTENVTVFFSASTFYFLLRYFKDRELGKEQAFHLMLSAGAYAGLCFNHISGFIYLPFFSLVLIAGMVSADTGKRAQHLAGYGLALAVAYFVSLWYGVTWSFPYSYDVYRAIFGLDVGTFFINHWAVTTLLSFICCAAVIYVARLFRSRIQSEWNKRSLGKIVILILMVFVACIVLNSVFQAYRMGYTNAYSKDAGFDRWKLSNSGLNVFAHSSLIALVLYVTPFLMGFLSLMLYLRRNTMSLYELFLLILIALFLTVRVGMDNFTFYYYYGRYLCGELVPYMTILAAFWIYPWFEGESKRRKIAAIAIIGFTLTYQAVFLAKQYPGGERYRLNESFRPVDRLIGSDDIIFFDSEQNPEFRTTMDYYYGKHTMVVDANNLGKSIRSYQGSWDNVYVLSRSDILPGLTYLGSLPLTQDRYKIGGFDLLPMKSTATVSQFYLYRADRRRSDFSSLSEDDTINFYRNGNASAYLAEGWSVPEKEFRWTEGEKASLILPFSNINSNLMLNFNLRAHNCVGVTVRVNGNIRAHWSFVGCRGFEDRILLLNHDDLKNGAVTVSFDMPGIKSPHDLDSANGDERKLGIAMTRIIINKATPKVNEPSRIQNNGN